MDILHRVDEADEDGRSQSDHEVVDDDERPLSPLSDREGSGDREAEKDVYEEDEEKESVFHGVYSDQDTDESGDDEDDEE